MPSSVGMTVCPQGLGWILYGYRREEALAPSAFYRSTEPPQGNAQHRLQTADPGISSIRGESCPSGESIRVQTRLINQSMSFSVKKLLDLYAIRIALLLVAIGAVSVAQAQQLTAANSDPSFSLPDAPLPAAGQQTAQSSSSSAEQNTPSRLSTPQESGTPQQTQRILGVMPNFNAITADTKLPPQSARDKFVLAARNSFDYSSFALTAIQSAISMASDSYPEFHQGAAGYGRYYWHTLLDTADENFMVGGAGPAIFHQDSRFYTLGHGGFRKRALYAATRVLITRSDAGNQTFNFSEIVGAGAASGASSLYYPSVYRTWTKVGQKWLTSCVIDSASYVFKEYWPDINHRIFHTK